MDEQQRQHLEEANRVFDEYVGRTLPAALEEASPPPETWPYGELAWAIFTEGARKLHRVEARRNFVLAVAERGYTPAELGGGELPRGVEVEVMTGRVRRFTPDLPDSTIARAGKALAAGIGHLDDIMRYYIESAAKGRLACALVTLEAGLQQAEAAAGIREPSPPLMGR